MALHFLAWWNVENLFDEEGYSGRTDKLQRTLRNELKGWSPEVRDRKLDQLSSVIAKMNSGKGPDIIGLCEVENRHVLDMLVARLSNHSYAVIHAETQDERGIDVAFLYDPAKYDISQQDVFFHVVLKRNATRDLVQANFKVKSSGRTLVVIGNHWPSRSSGELESEPYRMAAAETLAYYHTRITEIQGDDCGVVAMGDFNDEPFNRSLVNYALSSSNVSKVENAKVPYFYNLMWPLLSDGVGTYYFDSPNLLDQFLISKGIMSGTSGFSVAPGTVKREIYPGMADKGDYKKPVKFGRPTESLNLKGYSDHFPISLQLEEQ